MLGKALRCLKYWCFNLPLFQVSPQYNHFVDCNVPNLWNLCDYYKYYRIKRRSFNCKLKLFNTVNGVEATKRYRQKLATYIYSGMDWIYNGHNLGIVILLPSESTALKVGRSF